MLSIFKIETNILRAIFAYQEAVCLTYGTFKDGSSVYNLTQRFLSTI